MILIVNTSIFFTSWFTLFLFFGRLYVDHNFFLFFQHSVKSSKYFHIILSSLNDTLTHFFSYSFLLIFNSAGEYYVIIQFNNKRVYNYMCMYFFLCFLLFFFNFIFKVRVFINFFNFILQYLINFLIIVHDLFQFVWLWGYSNLE